MEERGAADARRRAARSGHPRADLPQGARALQEGGRQVPRSDSERPLELHDPEHPSLSEVAKEINGTRAGRHHRREPAPTIKAGQQLPGFAWLRDDGSTLSGNWLYCGSWTEAGQMQRRGTEDPSGLGVYPNWAWSWPANRRVMYNRASCDTSGKPWDPSRRQMWWNEAAGKWVGNDVPDFKVDSTPKDHMGPFIMNPEGVGRLFVPLAGIADGPFPEHYEPIESPDRQSAASEAIEQPGGQEDDVRHGQVRRHPAAATTSSARPTG